MSEEFERSLSERLNGMVGHLTGLVEVTNINLSPERLYAITQQAFELRDEIAEAMQELQDFRDAEEEDLDCEDADESDAFHRFVHAAEEYALELNQPGHDMDDDVVDEFLEAAEEHLGIEYE